MTKKAASANPPKPAEAPVGKDIRAFFLIWIGQVVSLVGTGLSRFGFGVWVFETTGSITQFTLITVAGSLPGLLVAPLAGAFIDRWDRRSLLIVADVASGLCVLGVALMHWQSGLEIWHIYLYTSVISVLNAFQVPAFLATASLMVPKKHFGRIGGLLQVGPATAGILAPISAGFLMVSIGLGGVILVDVITFLFAVGTLLLVRIPKPRPINGVEEHGSLREDILTGWRFLRERPALLGLLGFFAFINLVFSITMVLLTPMVLSFSSAAVLGMVSSVLSLGILVGGIVMSVHPGPKRRVYGVLVGGFFQGVGMILVGLRPQAFLIAAGLFCLSFSVAIVNANSQVIWQSKVPSALQGRVFAVRRMIAHFTQPVGQLMAGPMAARIFEPMLLPGGALVASVGPFLGVGPGRGIGLINVTFGVLPMIAAIVGYLSPRLRRLEEDLPDALSEESAGG